MPQPNSVTKAGVKPGYFAASNPPLRASTCESPTSAAFTGGEDWLDIARPVDPATVGVGTPVADSFEPERALTDVVVAAVEPVVVVAPHPVRTSARVAIAAHASTAKRPLEERVEPVARRVRLTRSTGTMWQLCRMVKHRIGDGGLPWRVCRSLQLRLTAQSQDSESARRPLCHAACAVNPSFTPTCGVQPRTSRASPASPRVSR